MNSEEFWRNRGTSSSTNREDVLTSGTSNHSSSVTPIEFNNKENINQFSHKAPLLSTDMRCYFGCNQGFKKDYDLRLHLKIKHKHENEIELQRAYQDAEDEIALTKRSLSLYQCALCPKQFDNNAGFNTHIPKMHNMAWSQYKSQYGSCEVERASFQCQICDRVVKYDKNVIHSHLTKLHRINWEMYLDRVRKLRKGEELDELPSVQLANCKICDSAVKNLTRHIKLTHKLNEKEYKELFNVDHVQSSVWNTPPSTGLSNHANRINHVNVEQPPMTKNLPHSSPSPETYRYNELASNMDYVQPSVWNPTSSKYLPSQINGANYVKVEPSSITPNMLHSISSLETASYPVMAKNIPTLQESPKSPPKTDIKDKTNRVCSTCNIRFETRPLFIKHCMLIHNITFKTHSGDRVCSPVTQQQIPQNAYCLKEEYSNSHGGVNFMSQPTSNAYYKHEFNSVSKPVYIKDNDRDVQEESMNIGSETRYGRKINKTKKM